MREVLIESIENRYRYFGAGGARGFDTVATMAVLELKKIYPDIRLILVLPCRNQTRGWKEADIQKYEWIKSKADKVVYTSEHYYNGCMQKRNRHLVDNIGLSIFYIQDKRVERNIQLITLFLKDQPLNILPRQDFLWKNKPVEK